MIINTDAKEITVTYTDDDEKATSKHDHDLIKVISKYNKVIDNYLLNGLIKKELHSTKFLEKHCSLMLNYYVNEDYDLAMKALAFNFALNKQQIIPPSMRGFQSIGKYKGLNKAEATYSLDLQVIDLHWLFLYREQINQLRATTIKNMTIYEKNHFKIDYAYEFALTPWSLKQKAEALLMDELEEIMLFRIMGTKTKNKKQTFNKERAKYQRQLLDYHMLPSTKISYDDIAEYLLYFEALRLASGNNRMAAQVFRYLTHNGFATKLEIDKTTRTISHRKALLKKIGLRIT